MKTEKLNLVIIRIVILTVMVILTSCRKSNRMESNVSKNVSDVAEARSETQGTAPRVRRLDGKPCERKIDWEAYYQSGLKEYGVNDFSTENLIALLDSENDIIKMYSAWLLGFRKEACAIPKLEEALNCRSICVRKAVTEALLNMGNRNGVPVLQEFIEKASEELQEGSYKNTIDMSYAASVLADANESGAFPPGEPHWQILSQPPCGTASLDVPAGLNTTLLQNPNAKGDYVVEAKCCSADTGDTITVRGKLPDDCSDCSTPPSVTPTINEVSGCGSCGTNCGICWPGAVGSHTYTLDTPCYDTCKWYARSDSVETTVYICRSCPANPPTVACLSDVANMTQAQACAHKLNFPNDSVQYSDISTSNWCEGCVAIHEETHMNQDWVQECLNPQILSFNNYLASSPIDIDCSVGSSVDCQTAITTTIKNGYDNEWQNRVQDAINTWNNDPNPEGDAEAAELACYQDILNALKTKCP